MGLLNRLMNKDLSRFGQEGKEPSSIEENATLSDILEFELQGTNINRDVAEKIAALTEGVNLIADTIASLPVYLYKRGENGDRERVKGDKRVSLLNLESNLYNTAYNTKKMLITDFLLHGNGYIDIKRNEFEEIETLINIPYRDITLNKPIEKNLRKAIYSYNYWGMEKVATHNVLNLVRNPKEFALEGRGLLHEGRAILKNAISLDNYTTTTLENGLFSKAVVEKDTTMTKKSRDSLISMLKRFFSGTKNAGKVIILDDGMKLKTLQLSPADLELLQQKEFTIKDIARLLKLQPSMLGVNNGGMTYSNEKDNQLVFLKNCIAPLLSIIENTFNKYLLKEEEKKAGIYFFEFNTQALLKANPLEEIKAYAEAVKGSLMSPNEARNKFNWGHIDGLDRPLISLAMGVMKEDGEIESHLSRKYKNVKGGD